MTDKSNGVIALVGNPSDGFTPYGPYPDFDTAITVMEGEECWIMEIRADADSVKIIDCDRPWCAHCKNGEK